MTRGTVSHRRHRFPTETISHAVWLYHVFSLSLRDGFATELVDHQAKLQEKIGEALKKLEVDLARQKKNDDNIESLERVHPVRRMELHTLHRCNYGGQLSHKAQRLSRYGIPITERERRRLLLFREACY
jgi:hypothetical protein